MNTACQGFLSVWYGMNTFQPQARPSNVLEDFEDFVAALWWMSMAPQQGRQCVGSLKGHLAIVTFLVNLPCWSSVDIVYPVNRKRRSRFFFRTRGTQVVFPSNHQQCGVFDLLSCLCIRHSALKKKVFLFLLSQSAGVTYNLEAIFAT